jgi:hypothetical protein
VKAYEFPTKLKSDGKLELPDTILKLIPNNQTVRVIILVSETTDAEELAAWNKITAEQFLAGYNEADSIYDRM